VSDGNVAKQNTFELQKQTNKIYIKKLKINLTPKNHQLIILFAKQFFPFQIVNEKHTFPLLYIEFSIAK
jgi:hypothetical protein